MDKDHFEGSLVLEKLAEVGKLDDFYEAIDSDNFRKAKILLESIHLSPDIITIVLKKMSDSEH